MMVCLGFYPCCFLRIKQWVKLFYRLTSEILKVVANKVQIFINALFAKRLSETIPKRIVEETKSHFL